MEKRNKRTNRGKGNSMKESKFANNFIDKLYEAVKDMYMIKIVGSEQQRKGVNDYLFSLFGQFVGIEFKIERNNKIALTPLQAKESNKIRKSGGQSLIIAYSEKEAKMLMNYKRELPIRFEKYISIDWDAICYEYTEAIEIILELIE